MKKKLEVYKDVKQAIKLCQKEINNKCEDSILKWAMSNDTFSEISQCYQFTNEAMDTYYKLLNRKDKNILTVCGSGDQVIYAMMGDAKNIDVFDTNKLTYYYLYLKISAIIGLNYVEFIDFINVYLSNNNQIKYYEKIRDLITQDDVKIFWDIFFKEQEHLFPALFMGQHNDIGANETGWNIYFTQTKMNVSYLNEEYFYHTKNKLKLNRSNINFKLVDLLNVNKYFNNTYDFINCSNIINYIQSQKHLIHFFSQLIQQNLNQDGLILMNYYWHAFNDLDRERLNGLLNKFNTDILTFKVNDIHPESILTYKK